MMRGESMGAGLVGKENQAPSEEDAAAGKIAAIRRGQLARRQTSPAIAKQLEKEVRRARANLPGAAPMISPRRLHAARPDPLGPFDALRARGTAVVALPAPMHGRVWPWTPLRGRRA